MEQSHKISAGEMGPGHVGHFIHKLPAALNHEGFSSVANRSSNSEKLRAASVAETTRLPLTERAVCVRGLRLNCQIAASDGGCVTDRATGDFNRVSARSKSDDAAIEHRLESFCSRNLM